MEGDKPCFVSRGGARDQSSCCRSWLGARLIELEGHTVHTVYYVQHRSGLSVVDLAAVRNQDALVCASQDKM
jgi:hypothetical protein